MGLIPEITLYYIIFTGSSGMQRILFEYKVLTLFVVVLILEK